MKRRIYVDFDGVIMDTWPFFYEVLQENDYELYEKLINKSLTHDDDQKIIKILNGLDWKQVIDKSLPINNSLQELKELYESNLFEVSVLTHCNSEYEAMSKTNLIDKHIPGLNVIPVYRPLRKDEAVNPKGSILIDDYGKNLETWEEFGGIGVKFSIDNDKKYNFHQIDHISKIINIIEETEEDKYEDLELLETNA